MTGKKTVTIIGFQVYVVVDSTCQHKDYYINAWILKLQLSFSKPKLGLTLKMTSGRVAEISVINNNCSNHSTRIFLHCTTLYLHFFCNPTILSA